MSNSGLQGRLEPIPAVNREHVEYRLERLPVRHSTTQRKAGNNLESPVNQTCTFLELLDEVGEREENLRMHRGNELTLDEKEPTQELNQQPVDNDDAALVSSSRLSCFVILSFQQPSGCRPFFFFFNQWLKFYPNPQGNLHIHMQKHFTAKCY